MVLVIGESAIRFRALALRNFQLVAETDGGDAKKLVVAFDAAFDLRFQIVCCGDSTRFQRAGKCAGQSTGERGDDVVDGSGKRSSVLDTVEFRVATVHSKVKGLRESFDVRVTEWPLLLNQANSGSMNKLTHRHLSKKQIPQERKSYKQVRRELLVVLN
jgi:hypothetical protein